MQSRICAVNTLIISAKQQLIAVTIIEKLSFYKIKKSSEYTDLRGFCDGSCTDSSSSLCCYSGCDFEG